MSQRKNKKHRPPMRRCIGCQESRPQKEMIRIVLEDGALVPDPDRTKKGRGVYLCRREECWAKARKKRGFSRAFRQNIPDDLSDRVIDMLRATVKEGDGDAE